MKINPYDAVFNHFLKWHVLGGQPPYVVKSSIKVEITVQGDAFVGFLEMRENETLVKREEHYSTAKVANLADPGRLERLNDVLGLPEHYAETHNIFLDIDPHDQAKIDRMKQQRCTDCSALIRIWPDVQWRLDMHKIRCDTCAGQIMARGEHYFDAYYVA